MGQKKNDPFLRLNNAYLRGMKQKLLQHIILAMRVAAQLGNVAELKQLSSSYAKIVSMKESPP